MGLNADITRSSSAARILQYTTFSSKHFTTKCKLQTLLLFHLKPKDLQTTRQ